MGEEVVTSMTWEGLGDLATRNTPESWGEINGLIPKLCIDPQIIKGAINGLIDKDQHIQDLSASVFGAQETDIFKNLVRTNTQLLSRLRRNVDSGAGPYAQFRAAAALGEHGYGSLEVISKLREFVDDPDVGDIAKRILSKLRQ